MESFGNRCHHQIIDAPRALAATHDQRVGRSGDNRRAMRQPAGSIGWNCVLTGMPVKRTLVFWRRRTVSGKLTNA